MEDTTQKGELIYENSVGKNKFKVLSILIYFTYITFLVFYFLNIKSPVLLYNLF